MSWYRNTYLKSDDWKNLRDAKLALSDGRCTLCRKLCESLDVHHLQYKRIYDVKVWDLRVVCRDCHEKTHKLMEKYPKLKKLPNELQWSTVFNHISPYRKNGEHNKLLRLFRKVNQRQHRAQNQFSICRNVLVDLGLASRTRLKFKPAFVNLAWFVATNPILFLRAYMNWTGTDPRAQWYRVGSKNLLTPTPWRDWTLIYE